MHEFHEFASMFPLMEGEEFDQFVADIKENGQREPIIMLGDKVLDGRNRYLACQRLGIEPRMRDFNCLDGDPLHYIWSQNVTRRHLTPAQRAIAIAKRATFLEKGDPETATRRWQTGTVGRATDRISEEQAAEIAGVSTRAVGRAKAILTHGTKEEIAAVERGKEGLYPVHEKVMARRRERIANEEEVTATNRGGYMRIAIPEGHTAESFTRHGIEVEEKEGLEPHKMGKRLGISEESYRKMREIVLIADRTDLTPKDREAAITALAALNETKQTSRAYPLIEEIAKRIWGNSRGPKDNRAEKRVEEFEKQIDIITHVCEVEVDIPQLSQEKYQAAVTNLENSVVNLRKLIRQLREIYDG